VPPRTGGVALQRKTERNAASQTEVPIEHVGVEPVPEKDRTATAKDFFQIAFGAAVATTTIIIGTIPIALGLSFWAAASAIVVGVIAGAFLLSPLAVVGSRTHTNNAVSSGAHFGVRGRVIGSFLSLLIAITFFMISVWVGGDAMTAGLARLFPELEGDLLSAAGYALTAAVIFTVCVVGYRWLLAANRFIAPLVVALLVLGAIAFMGDFDPSFAGAPDSYAFGTFAATWVAAMLIAMANPMSYGPFLGDWSRYVPSSVEAKKLRRAIFGAQLVSLVPFLFGAATATLVPDAGNYINGLVAVAPAWYVAALVVVAVAGGIAGGVASLYGTGLDFSSLVPAVSRIKGTLLIGTLAIALVFVGRFAIDMVDTVNSFLTLILIFAAPWTAIMLVGMLTRRSFYDSEDLQVFNRGQSGGRYWFTNGMNYRAVGSWTIGSVLGLMLANTTLFTGPLSGIADGIDVSFFVALAVTVAVYWVSLRLFPEPRYVFDERGPRHVPALDADPPPVTAERSGARSE